MVDELTLPTWREMNRDTSPEAEAVLLALLRAATAAEKCRRIVQLNHAVRRAALAGLRRRYPSATEEEISRRLADLLLGPELARRAYGPLPERTDD